MAGTEGRVYGGDCNLVHVPDGKRTEVGVAVADVITTMIRAEARAINAKISSRTNDGNTRMMSLCPGCYMIVGLNALVELARRNGQSRRELALTMAQAFQKLAECEPGDEACIEEITVVLDGATQPELCA